MFITRLLPLLFRVDDPGGATPPAPEGAPPAAPSAAPAAPEIPAGYVTEDRYKEAQAWGTRLAQERTELEADAQIAKALRSSDPAERKAALEAVGLALADEPADPNQQLYDQLDPQTLARLEAVEQHIGQTSAETQRQQEYTAYRGLTDPELTSMNVPAALHDVVAEAALNLPPVQTPQGPRPDLQGAYDQLLGLAEHFGEIPAVQERFAALPAVQKAVKTAWAASKPRAAVTTPAGQAGTQLPDPLDGEARRQRILDRYEANRH